MKTVTKIFALSAVLLLTDVSYAKAQKVVQYVWNNAAGSGMSITLPTGTSASVTVTGGGGAGGGAAANKKNTPTYAAGGGGGGGCVATQTLIGGVKYDITVGKGGVGSACSDESNVLKNGGKSTITGGGTTVTANGGTGGTWGKNDPNDPKGSTAIGAGGKGCTAAEDGTKAFQSGNILTGGTGGGNAAPAQSIDLTTMPSKDIRTFPGTASVAGGAGAGGTGAVIWNTSSANSMCASGNWALGGNGSDGQVVVNVTLDLPQVVMPAQTLCVGDMAILTIGNYASQYVTYSLYEANGAYVGNFSGNSRSRFFTEPGVYQYYVTATYNLTQTGAAISPSQKDLTTTSEIFTVTVLPKKETPALRWGYNGVCPIDESRANGDHDAITHFTNGNSNQDIFTDEAVEGWDIEQFMLDNQGYFPDSTDMENNYFANLIMWNYLVENGLTEEEIYEAGADFSNIRWYADAAGTIDVTEEMQNAYFWQNEPYARKTYYAQILSDNPNQCNSDLIPVTVEIGEPVVNPVCFSAYTKPGSGDMIGWEEILRNPLSGNSMGSEQGLWFFANEDDANAGKEYAEKRQEAPENCLNPIENYAVSFEKPSATTLWAVRYDELEEGEYACVTDPFPVTITMYERPKATMRASNGLLRDTVCAGTAIDLPVEIGNDYESAIAHAPYHFVGYSGNVGEVTAANIQNINGKAVYMYHIPAATAPLQEYRILELWDANRTPSLTEESGTCFFYEPYDMYTDTIIIRRYAAPSFQTFLKPQPAVCEGTALVLPEQPVFSANADEGEYRTGWLLGDKSVEEGYVLQTADNGKILCFYVANMCDSVVICTPLTVNEMPEITVIDENLCGTDKVIFSLTNPQLKGEYSIVSGSHVGTLTGNTMITNNVTGAATVQFTTIAGCSATVDVNVTARTVIADFPRWDYASICPLDANLFEEDYNYIRHWKVPGSADIMLAEGKGIEWSENLLTNRAYQKFITNNPTAYPDTTDMVNNYFSNYVVWDWLVLNGADENNEDFYTLTEDGEIDSDLFNNINWYNKVGNEYVLIKTNGELTAEGEALQAEGKFLPFWQDKPHADETYYASLQSADSCESKMIAITVHIMDSQNSLLNITDLVGYVSEHCGNLDYRTFLENQFYLEKQQTIEWYATEELALAAFGDATVGLGDGDISDGEKNPYNINNSDFPKLLLCEPVDTTFYIMKADEWGCRTIPTPYRVQLMPLPYCALTLLDENGDESDNLQLCSDDIKGKTLKLKVSFTGTAPFTFSYIDEDYNEVHETLRTQNDTIVMAFSPSETREYFVYNVYDSLTVKGLVTADLFAAPEYANDCSVKVEVVNCYACPNTTRFYVKEGATGNGFSWDDAMNLADALRIGQLCDIDTILVAKGTYYPQYQPLSGLGTEINGGSNSVTFQLYDNLVFWGSFPNTLTGTEIPAIRDYEADATILSGDIDRNGVTDEGNVYSVVYAEGRRGKNYETATIKSVKNIEMDGFSITGGYAPQSAQGDVFNANAYGAGMYLLYVNESEFSHLNVYGNAVGNSGNSGVGGAAFTIGNDNYFAYLTIHDNTSLAGDNSIDGMVVNGMNDIVIYSRFYNAAECALITNLADAGNATNVIVQTCIFDNNATKTRSAVVAGGTTQLVGNTFYNNTKAAVYNVANNLAVVGNLFYDNDDCVLNKPGKKTQTVYVYNAFDNDNSETLTDESNVEISVQPIETVTFHPITAAISIVNIDEVDFPEIDYYGCDRDIFEVGEQVLRDIVHIKTAGAVNGIISLLPISLINFQVECINNTPRVSWTTETETNNEYFVIERSLNGIDFEQIAIINGAGNSTINLNYEYMDHSMANNSNLIYYRLKQVDFNGQSETFKVVVYHNCNNENTVSVTVFPTQFRNDITVELSDFSGDKMVIEIFDTHGKQVYNTTRYNTGAQNIDLSTLVAGVYTVRTIAKNQVFVDKIIKR